MKSILIERGGLKKSQGYTYDGYNLISKDRKIVISNLTRLRAATALGKQILREYDRFYFDKSIIPGPEIGTIELFIKFKCHESRKNPVGASRP